MFCCLCLIRSPTLRIQWRFHAIVRCSDFGSLYRGITVAHVGDHFVSSQKSPTPFEKTTEFCLSVQNRHLIKLDKLLLPIILHWWHFSPHHQISTIKFNCIWNYICRNEKLKEAKSIYLQEWPYRRFLPYPWEKSISGLG